MATTRRHNTLSDYKKLEVWQKAHQLVLKIYKLTLHFPKEELYGLTSQIRRAAISVPANIAEGTGKGSNSELVRYLRIAMGSAKEVEYYLLLGRDLGFIEIPMYQEIEQEAVRIIRMLTGLIRSLKTSNS
jgi:four helix bundle protein